jgi:hypothetical protein
MLMNVEAPVRVMRVPERVAWDPGRVFVLKANHMVHLHFCSLSPSIFCQQVTH